jgi:hypothetical protein
MCENTPNRSPECAKRHMLAVAEKTYEILKCFVPANKICDVVYLAHEHDESGNNQFALCEEFSELFRENPENVFNKETNQDTADAHKAFKKLVIDNEELENGEWNALLGLSHTLGCVDPNQLTEVTEQVNPTYLLIKAVEILDNLKHPLNNGDQNHRAKRSRYLDAVAALSFYYPLLEMMGPEYRRLASEISGEAYQTIYQTIVPGFIPPLAMEAVQYRTNQANRVMEDFGESVTNKLLALNDGINKIIKPQTELFTESSIKIRAKHLGSSLWKMVRKSTNNRDIAPDSINDVIGLTVILDDGSLHDNPPDYALSELYSTVKTMLENAGLGLSTDSIMGGNYNIDYCYGEAGADSPDDLKSNITDGLKSNIPINRSGRRSSNYGSIYLHYNLPHLDTIIPVEVQIMEHGDWEEARVGTASHINYKTSREFTEETFSTIRNWAGRIACI